MQVKTLQINTPHRKDTLKVWAVFRRRAGCMLDHLEKHIWHMMQLCRPFIFAAGASVTQMRHLPLFNLTQNRAEIPVPISDFSARIRGGKHNYMYQIQLCCKHFYN